MRSTGILIALLLFAVPLRADETELSLQTQAARAHYRAGQVYFRSGELRRALAEFRAAQLDDARPELDYNLGLTLDRLGDAAAAIDAYRRFLSVRPDSEERSRLEQRILVLERSVGELELKSRVVGASITIDDEPLGASRVEAAVRLTVGSHVVVASKDGYVSTRLTVQIAAGTRARLAIDPHLSSDATLSRKAKLGIGLGVGGGVLAVTGIVLGVYFGTREPAPFDPGGAAGVVAVRPLAARRTP